MNESSVLPLLIADLTQYQACVGSVIEYGLSSRARGWAKAMWNGLDIASTFSEANPKH